VKFKQVISSNSLVKATKKVRQYVPKAKQRKYIACWQESGLSQSEFCKRHKVNPKTFSNWLSTVGIKVREVLPPPQKTVSDSLSNDVCFQCQFPNGIALVINGVNDGRLMSLLIQEVAQCKFN